MNLHIKSLSLFFVFTLAGFFVSSFSDAIVSCALAHEKCNCGDKAPTNSTFDDDVSLPGDTNEMCPVMTDVEAEDLWTTVYKGKVVRFCCNNCVESFRREPEKYVDNLPQFKTAAAAPINHQMSDEGILGVQFSRIFLIVTFLAVIPFLWDRKSFNASPMFLYLVLALAVGAVIVAASLYQANQGLKLEVVKQKAKSEIHLATYYDYGVPPVPDNPQLQPELSKSFYRGNDERSQVLFNGGNYQTAQFDIAIQYANGTPVRVGDALTDETLYLYFTIQKPENAPKRMYDKKLMSRMFLTRSYAPDMGWDKPIEDKTPLDVVEEDERWHCRFPLNITSSNSGNQFNPQTVSREKLATVNGIGAEIADWFVAYRDAGYPIVGPDDLRQAGITGKSAEIISASLDQSSHDGLIYVCEAFFHQQRQLGARFHYGIKYDLQVRDGRVASGSEIWMGALSRSLKAKKGAIPDNQWLSSQPLPQLPSAQNISDKLLGIDDYDF